MGSTKSTESIRGTFDVLVDNGEVWDPTTKPYFKGPGDLPSIKRTYDLKDFRSDVHLQPGSNESNLAKAVEHLSQNGFTAVRHRSTLLESLNGRLSEFQSIDLMKEVYYPEIEALVKQVTGCSKVFVTHSLIRGKFDDQSAIEAASEKEAAKLASTPAEAKSTYKDLDGPLHKPEPVPPTRLPHIDLTPRGARQDVRFARRDIAEHAAKIGVISIEDEICAKHGVDAIGEFSDEFIAASYNTSNGPRYAAFSVWRPLKKVTRDPLAIARYEDVMAASAVDGTFLWKYHIRIPSAEGDWYKELAVLMMSKGAPEKFDGRSPLEWHYIPEQDVDEVLIIKFFDSASLAGGGEESFEAAGAPHGSPDIGEAGYGDPRLSIEVRVIAFW